MRRSPWIFLALAFLGGGAWLWIGEPVRLKERVLPRRFAKVAPHLYRSGQIDRGLIEGVLHRYRIDVVLDLQPGEPDVDARAERRLLAERGLRLELVPLADSGPADADGFARAVAILREALGAGDNVLVHCDSGERRAGDVLAAFALLGRGDEALADRELVRFAPADPARLRAELDARLPAIAARLAAPEVVVARPGAAALVAGR